MKLLDAVNTVLPFLNEHTITSVEDTQHPTVGLIVAAIERHTRAMLLEGYWFNELEQTLLVNTDGRINAPESAMAIYGLDCNVSLRDEFLFDLDTGSYYFTKPIKVRIIESQLFQELPEQAALTITYSAGVEVYTADFGVESAVGMLQQLAEYNRQQLRQEELRNRKYNNGNYVRTRMRGFYKWR